MNDLDMAVELVNTVYALADPPDRLTSVEHFRGVLRRGGQAQLADELTDADLDRLHRLRERLRPLFGVDSPERAIELINPLLAEYSAAPALTLDPEGLIRTLPGGTQHGFRSVAARSVTALAEHLAGHGIRRLGVCSAAPCDCVFVDRTRPGTRKYCCDGCNDRAAAAAHYRRRRAGAVTRNPTTPT